MTKLRYMAVLLLAGCFVPPSFVPFEDVSNNNAIDASTDVAEDSSSINEPDAAAYPDAFTNEDAENNLTPDVVSNSVAAEDWTQNFPTWLFDGDLTSTVIPLMTNAAGTTFVDDSVQGIHAIEMGILGEVEIDVGPETELTNGLSFGGWLKLDDTRQTTLMTLGQLRMRYSNGRIECIHGISRARSDSRITIDEWNHIMCHYDADQNEISISFNGEYEDEDSLVVNIPLTFSFITIGFEGSLDEFFLATFLGDDIERIVSCGVDGKLCRCESDNPEDYSVEGRFDPGTGDCNRSPL